MGSSNGTSVNRKPPQVRRIAWFGADPYRGPTGLKKFSVWHSGTINIPVLTDLQTGGESTFGSL
jgi:hypothetical protein